MSGDGLSHAGDDVGPRWCKGGYRAILLDCFERRVRANARYSLRAFARDLALAPSTLSEILRERHELSPATAERIAPSLGLGRYEAARFLDLVSVADRRSHVRREAARARLSATKASRGDGADDDAPYERLGDDTFALVASWPHLALLECFELPALATTREALAQALRLDVETVRRALDRLVRLGLARVGPNGRYEAASEFTTAGRDTPNAAVRDFHKGLLARAARAIDAQSTAMRHVSATIMAFDASRLDEAKSVLRDFQREFVRRFSAGGVERDNVYSISLQFFSLTEGLAAQGRPPAAADGAGRPDVALEMGGGDGCGDGASGSISRSTETH